MYYNLREKEYDVGTLDMNTMNMKNIHTSLKNKA